MASTHTQQFVCVQGTGLMGDQLKLYADCSAISAIHGVKIDTSAPTLITSCVCVGGGGNKVFVHACLMTECDVLLLGN